VATAGLSAASERKNAARLTDSSQEEREARACGMGDPFPFENDSLSLIGGMARAMGKPKVDFAFSRL
jgi:hypothetical protein